MTAAAEIDTATCAGAGISTCDLPGSQAFATDAERAAVLATLEPDYGEVLGTDIYLAWGAMAAIIGTIFVLLVIVQKRKDVI
jgi:hypothetical protein